VTRQSYRICLTAAAVSLVAIAGAAATSVVDVRISDAIFTAGGGAWPLPHSGWTRAVGYEGPKYLVIAFALVLIAGLARPSLLRRIRLEPAEAAYLLACLALVPATIGALRSQSGIACASQLLRYGGDIPDWLGHFTITRLFADNGLHGCFPSGHASGGFALLALGMLDRKPATRRALWLGAMLYGSWMGAYQLLRGAHFLSHVVASALVAQLVVCVFARYMLAEKTVQPGQQLSVPLS
jgi:membrane-associated PAP2 superfamily phosphatase